MNIKDVYKFFSPKHQSLFLEYKVNFRPRYGEELPPHTELYSIINANRKDYENILLNALEYKDLFWQIKDARLEQEANKPAWNNGFLPGLDIIGLYTVLSIYRPKKYIEIGSGNSTKVAYKAIREQKLETEIVSIDPFPRAEIDQLADKVMREPFENIDNRFLADLGENDILFVDNSHRILPNSDSMVFFMEVLPRLKKGVIVHLHDIYLPYDYPQFMCDRFYSEQYGLAMYLLANPLKYKTLLPNYFIYKDEALSKVIEPLWQHENLKNVERHGGSFWIQIQ
jgi:hypothetical protein